MRCADVILLNNHSKNFNYLKWLCTSKKFLLGNLFQDQLWKSPIEYRSDIRLTYLTNQIFILGRNWELTYKPSKHTWCQPYLWPVLDMDPTQNAGKGLTLNFIIIIDFDCTQSYRLNISSKNYFTARPHCHYRLMFWLNHKIRWKKN